jgi:hypothetical protein
MKRHAVRPSARSDVTRALSPARDSDVDELVQYYPGTASERPAATSASAR